MTNPDPDQPDNDAKLEHHDLELEEDIDSDLGFRSRIGDRRLQELDIPGNEDDDFDLLPTGDPLPSGLELPEDVRGPYDPLPAGKSEFAPSRKNNNAPVALVLASVLLSGFLLVMWVAYQRGVQLRQQADILPQITADEPYRLRPDEPGGASNPHMDKLIYEQIDDTGNKEVAAIEKAPAMEPPVVQESPVEQEPPYRIRNRAVVEESSGQPPPPPPQEVSIFDPEGSYMVQLSSSRSQQGADQEWERISRLYTPLFDGAPKRIQRADLGERGIYFRLRVGPLLKLEDAKTLCRQYTEQGGNCLVVRR